MAACQALPGARGEIATLLAPEEHDLSVLKPRHSAFHSTPLDHLLHELKARELVVVGLATDMCVHLTVGLLHARIPGLGARQLHGRRKRCIQGSRIAADGACSSVPRARAERKPECQLAICRSSCVGCLTPLFLCTDESVLFDA